MRLIDADTLKDTLLKHRYTTEHNQIFRYIDEQPTAYDADKVAEELKRIRAKKTCNKEKCDTKEICRICVVDDAIEIVKQCVVSDDVCEWEKDEHSENDNPTEWIICPHKPKRIFSKDIKYCPYYGKKIKVVEQMDEDELRYCHHDDTDEYHDCLDYMECEECPYYYADLDQESD